MKTPTWLIDLLSFNIFFFTDFLLSPSFHFCSPSFSSVFVFIIGIRLHHRYLSSSVSLFIVTAPANPHAHATGVAVFPTLFLGNSIGGYNLTIRLFFSSSFSSFFFPFFFLLFLLFLHLNLLLLSFFVVFFFSSFFFLFFFSFFFIFFIFFSLFFFYFFALFFLLFFSFFFLVFVLVASCT